MNRRDFMGSVVGGIATAKLATSGRIAYGKEAAAAPAAVVPSGGPPQGAWIRNGLIDAGGDHEPYIYVVRRGGQSPDAHEHYEYEQSEALIRKLKDEGVEVFHTHLYKGSLRARVHGGGLVPVDHRGDGRILVFSFPGQRSVVDWTIQFTPKSGTSH